MPRSARVGLAREGNRRDNVRAAMELVRKDIVPRVRERVMLKPNFLSDKHPLACTQADACRGALDFLASVPNRPKQIVIAEGGNEEASCKAFENYGYYALADEYDFEFEFVDLNQETEWETTPIKLDNGDDYLVHMPKTVLDCPCTISVAVAKTHDVCIVTLALKNMIMGTIRKEDRVKMHGFMTHKERLRPNESQTINVNLIRLARHMAPDISIVDGTVALEGDGPLGDEKTAVDLGVAAAGIDVFAVDAVVTKIMGWEPLQLALTHYGDALEMGVADLDNIEVLGTHVADVARPFAAHKWIDEQMQWQTDKAQEIGVK